MIYPRFFTIKEEAERSEMMKKLRDESIKLDVIKSESKFESTTFESKGKKFHYIDIEAVRTHFIKDSDLKEDKKCCATRCVIL